MESKKKIIIFLALFTLVFSLVTCMPQKTHRILTFFFDGVPDWVYADNGIDSSFVDSTELIANIDTVLIPQLVYHKPYREEKCYSCHDKQRTGSLNKREPSLCYGCHKEFNNRYTNLHGPFGSGKCSQCHEPHKSIYKSLLKRDGVDVCLYCHQDTRADTSNLHSVIKITACTECHDPHGGENRFMLKEGKCILCHDDFPKQYKYLHGPVAAGYCNLCHDNHASKSKAHLLIAGQKLCLSCHKKNSIFKNKKHDGQQNEDCVKCHNPHGGDDSNILAQKR